MKRLILGVVALLPLALLAADPYIPTDAERARWTMHDMQSWRICFAAYKQDHSAYPEAKSAEAAKALFEPIYIQHLPMTDAWGNAYDVKSDAAGFRVVSAGADGKFDRSTWSAEGKQSSFDADAVATNDGRWLFRSWDMK